MHPLKNNKNVVLLSLLSITEALCNYTHQCWKEKLDEPDRLETGKNSGTHCSLCKWCISFQFSTNLYGRALWNLIALAVYSKFKYRNTSLNPLLLTWFICWQSPPVSGKFPKIPSSEWILLCRRVASLRKRNRSPTQWLCWSSFAYISTWPSTVYCLRRKQMFLDRDSSQVPSGLLLPEPWHVRYFWAHFFPYVQSAPPPIKKPSQLLSETSVN